MKSIICCKVGTFKIQTFRFIANLLPFDSEDCQPSYTHPYFITNMFTIVHITYMCCLRSCFGSMFSKATSFVNKWLIT